MSSDESTPRCPICGAPGERGVLYGHTSLRLKWLAAHRPLFLGAFALGATPVGQSGWRFPSGRARAYGLSCDKCGKVFLDNEAMATERQLVTLVRQPLLMAAILGGFAAGFYLLDRAPAVCMGLGVVFSGVIGFHIGKFLVTILGRSIGARSSSPP